MTDAKLPPRAAFTAQIIGTLLGAILNYCKRVYPASPADPYTYSQS